MFGLHRWLGWMLQPGMGNRLPPGEVWAADNGCFARPDLFDMDEFLRWLDYDYRDRARCLFVTAPDRLGQWEETLRVAEPALVQLRAAGWPAALVAQDGLVPERTPWGSFDTLFIGGTTTWKLGHGAAAMIRAAVRRGVRVHVGRVNSYRRFKTFQVLGVGSVDGTRLKYGPDVNSKDLARWLAALEMQPSLPL